MEAVDSSQLSFDPVLEVLACSAHIVQWALYPHCGAAGAVNSQVGGSGPRTL